MNKLLVICGLTSTGKTTLALKLAKKFNGEIVSADSRQVYKGMDIGTGKDLPVNLKLKIKNLKLGGVYEINGVPLWGYDLVEPTEEFNISEYLNFAIKVILDIQKRGKLPILVGGTGFYIKGIIDGIPTVNVPANKELRKNLECFTASNLFEKLAELDAEKAGSMNSSDKKNPRRLIRAIEIAQYMLDHKSLKIPFSRSHDDILMIGLSAPMDIIFENINKRVGKRVADGIKEEIKKLLKNGVNWSAQSMLSLGYRQWRDFFEGRRPVRPMARRVLENRIMDDWKREEKKYAKRQMTWFKKDKRIKWFDISDKKMLSKVEKDIILWYK